MTLDEEYEILLRRYEKADDWFRNKSTVQEQEKHYDEFVKLVNRLSEIKYLRELKKMNNFEELQKLIINWAKDKNLLHAENADKQFLKFIEEVFEFKTELDSEKHWRKVMGNDTCKSINIESLMLEMGDIFVTLIILCNQIGIEPTRCLDMAYEKIKGRTGKTINGVFVKAEDLKE